MSRDAEPLVETLLGRARQDLAAAEREEATERGTLMSLIDRDRHLRYAMEQTSLTVRTTRDADGLLVAHVRADAFCHSMVRSLVR